MVATQEMIDRLTHIEDRAYDAFSMTQRLFDARETTRSHYLAASLTYNMLHEFNEELRKLMVKE